MKVITLDEVNSTNSYAKANISEIEDKTVICALKQTSGRGRLSRVWVDLGENNLFLTIVLKPENKYNQNFANLTQYLSVVLCKIFEKNYALKPQIKWPNDVLINGKKIAGILCETVIQGDNFKGLALGLGVNLNASDKDVKNIPDKIATALNLEVNCAIDLDSFRKDLLNEFFENYEKFLNEGFNFIKEDYEKRNCFLNKEINVKTYKDIKSGLAKSLTDKGELVLQTNEKEEITLTIGDIL